MTRHDTPVPRSGRPAGTARAVRGAAAAVLCAALALLGPAVPAGAHGGPIVISVGTDGAGGITANLSYHDDGHPVEESADVTVTAVSDGGESVGPLELRSASEGVGWYVSEPGVLAEGHWTITATITTPAEATATAEVDVVPLPERAAPDASSSGAEQEAVAGDGADEAGGDTDAQADAAAGAEDGSDAGASTAVWVVLALAVLAAGALGAVVARRRSRTLAGTSAR